MHDNSKKFKAAVIGCGNIGLFYDLIFSSEAIYTHVGAYTKHPAFDLVACADRDETQKSNLEKVNRNAWFFTNYKELFEKVTPDVISVATTPDVHKEIIETAVRSGVKAVFCEKPLGGSLAVAREIVSICNSSGVGLFVNCYMRYSQFYTGIKDSLSDSVGTLNKVVYTYSKGLVNSGFHVIDLWLRWWGKFKSVQALDIVENGKDDFNVDVMVEFCDGGTGWMISTDMRNYVVSDMEVFGDSGKLMIALNRTTTYWKPKRFYKVLKQKNLDFVKVVERSASESPILDAVDQIRKWLDGNICQEECQDRDSIKVWEVLEAIHKSCKTRQKVYL